RIGDMLAIALSNMREEHPPKQFASRIESRIQKDRSHHRFQRVCDNCSLFPAAGLLFAAAKPEEFAYAEPFCRILQSVRVHQVSSAARELPFAPPRKRIDQEFARQKIENGVTQKLQPFIVLNLGGDLPGSFRGCAQLRNRRTVSQRRDQQLPVAESITQPLFKLLVGLRHAYGCCRPSTRFTWARSVASLLAFSLRRRRSCTEPEGCRRSPRTL